MNIYDRLMKGSTIFIKPNTIAWCYSDKKWKVVPDTKGIIRYLEKYKYSEGAYIEAYVNGKCFLLRDEFIDKEQTETMLNILDV